MGHKTPLHEAHLAAGARMVDFGGWDMPLHYGSQMDEHHRVRRSAGLFDVSHMTIVDVDGDDAESWLRYLLANDVRKLASAGAALYTAMLNEQGGVIDDLIVYRMPAGYRLVVNSATREKDLAWMQARAEGRAVELRERQDLAMLALQGPEAQARAASVWPDLADSLASLRGFHALTDRRGWMWCRTGYTGEDGFEILLPASASRGVWDALVQQGVAPCGLGARDTLRLEAGMNLYGSDMDEQVTPLECGMGWTIAWEPLDRAFIGRAALEAQRGAAHRMQVALVLPRGGVLRSHQTVHAGDLVGEITSGSFSPTLGVSIALARVPSAMVSEGRPVEVDVRGRRLPVQVVKAPFVRKGRILVSV